METLRMAVSKHYIPISQIQVVVLLLSRQSRNHLHALVGPLLLQDETNAGTILVVYIYRNTDAFQLPQAYEDQMLSSA